MIKRFADRMQNQIRFHKKFSVILFMVYIYQKITEIPFVPEIKK